MDPSKDKEVTQAAAEVPPIVAVDTSLARVTPKKDTTASPEPVYTPVPGKSDSNGQAPAPTDDQLYSPSISIREWILHLPHPLPHGAAVPYSLAVTGSPIVTPPGAVEETSTVVLTSPRRTFVDLRFFKGTDTQTPLPNRGERDRLQWAFAGSSAMWEVPDPYTRPGDDPWDTTWHAKWVHWLDSRHDSGASDIPIDQGDMYAVSVDRTVEVGAMWSPHHAAITAHEEMWRDDNILSTTFPSGGPRMCVVLRCEDPAIGLRGLIIRLGQYIQGILMCGTKHTCTVERWEFDFEARAVAEREALPGAAVGETQFWRRTARVGDLFMPCLASVRLDVGIDEWVTYLEQKWVVEEAVAFGYADPV